jgi:aspartate oxidase
VRPEWKVPEVSTTDLRDLMWQNCGILRNRDGLESAISALRTTSSRPVAQPTVATIELRNIFEVAGLISRSALWREESRGAHYRTDFPERRELFACDSQLSRSE